MFRTKHIGGHKGPENSLMGLEELLFDAALWGAPRGLLWISWQRYRAVPGAGGTNRSLALASLALLSLSSGIWLLVLIDDYSKMTRSILNLVPTTGVLAVNQSSCLSRLVNTFSADAEDSSRNYSASASPHLCNRLYGTGLDVCPYQRPLG